MDQLPVELVQHIFHFLSPKALDSFSQTCKLHDSWVSGKERSDSLINSEDWREAVVHKYLGKAGVFINYHEFRQRHMLVWEPLLFHQKLRIRNIEFDFSYEASIVAATHNYNGSVVLIAPDQHMWGIALNIVCPPRLVAIVSRSKLMSLFTVGGDLVYSMAEARTMYQWNMQCQLIQSRITLGQLGGIGMSKQEVRYCFIDESVKGGISFEPCENPQAIYSVVNSLQHMAYQSKLMLSSLSAVLSSSVVEVNHPPDRSPLYWEFGM